MTIEPLLYSDLEAAGALTPEGWTDLAPHFEYNIRSSFCIPLKAVVEHTLAGVGNVICNGDSAWLAQVVVHPAFRGRGIGKAMTAALIGHIDRERFPRILLDATDLGFPVYQSLGFKVISHHIHFTGDLLVPAVLPDLFIQPFEHRHIDSVLMLDRKATGEDRQATLREHLDKALVYTQEGRIEGIYYPTLGRGAVTAITERAGKALMRLRLQERNHAMIPEENLTILRWLEQQGFAELRRSRRMCLGEAPDWKPGLIFNVVSGALG